MPKIFALKKHLLQSTNNQSLHESVKPGDLERKRSSEPSGHRSLPHASTSSLSHASISSLSHPSAGSSHRYAEDLSKTASSSLSYPSQEADIEIKDELTIDEDYETGAPHRLGESSSNANGSNYSNSPPGPSSYHGHPPYKRVSDK